MGYENLFDDLSAIQRKLEVSLVQWTSFDESYGQVEHWLRQMESQLEGQIPLRSTLEEKKTQLHNYKVCAKQFLVEFLFIAFKFLFLFLIVKLKKISCEIKYLFNIIQD